VEVGLVVVPEYELLEDDVITYMSKGTETNAYRVKMKLTLTFINPDEPEQSLKVTSHGYGVDNGDKGPGKAMSYAYKYALLKLFCLETGDDPDNDATSSDAVKMPQSQNKTITPAQESTINQMASGKEWLVNSLLKKANYNKLSDLPGSRFREFVQALQRDLEKVQ
jgi:hypothetical protein